MYKPEKHINVIADAPNARPYTSKNKSSACNANK